MPRALAILAIATLTACNAQAFPLTIGGEYRTYTIPWTVEQAGEVIVGQTAILNSYTVNGGASTFVIEVTRTSDPFDLVVAFDWPLPFASHRPEHPGVTYRDGGVDVSFGDTYRREFRVWLIGAQEQLFDGVPAWMRTVVRTESASFAVTVPVTAPGLMIPEPGTGVLVLLGLAVLGRVRCEP